jgi:RND family efflux transporter MFP subunit
MTSSFSRQPRGRRWASRIGVGIPALIATAVFTTGCSHAPPSAKAKVPEVIVTTPITDRVTDYQDFTGRLEAIPTVDIRARVAGYVTQVPFKEGDLVKKGDLLFQVDSRTYQADYDQAVANHKQALADMHLQEKNVARVGPLLRNGSATQEEFDQVTGALERAQAQVGATKAAQDRAQLYLEYTRVTSPINGRVSRRYVDPGNLITADNTLLTTIVAEDPMYAYFDVDERTYLDLVNHADKKISMADAGPWMGEGKYPVWMRLADEEEYKRGGTIDFVDNRLSGNTGTIRLRGVFENPRHVLKAGLFVRIRLPIGQSYTATLIPDEAVQSDQGRKYVFAVVKKDDKEKVEYRPVELGQAISGLRVIKKGVSPGERVIISGMQRVKADVEVQPKPQDPPKPPSASGKQLTYDLPAGRPAGDGAAVGN